MTTDNKMLPDVNEFIPSTCIDTNRTIGTGGISVVYSSNGKRLTLNAAILKHFSNKESVQIAYNDSLLAIATFLGDEHTDYVFSKSGKNGVIYNAALVKEIVSQFHLDFSNRTSITFPVYELQEQENEKIVIINMKS